MTEPETVEDLPDRTGVEFRRRIVASTVGAIIGLVGLGLLLVGEGPWSDPDYHSHPVASWVGVALGLLGFALVWYAWRVRRH